MSSRERSHADDELLAEYEDKEEGNHVGNNYAAHADTVQSATAAREIVEPGTVVETQRLRLKERALHYNKWAELRCTDLSMRWFEWSARIAIFIVYFWFGILKVLGVSPATPLATALVKNTIGLQYFNASFKALAFFECGLGILFLIPALTWLCSILLIIHMGIVCSPLVLVSNVAFTHPGVPTLEGQYIIKDLALIALTIGLLAYRRSSQSQRKVAVAPAK